MEKLEQKQEDQFIRLPEDENLRSRLEAKLTEYQERINQSSKPHLGTKHKIAVLERLLRDGQVNLPKLSQELFRQEGFDYNDYYFYNACGVIKDYAETGGKRVFGGTGLKAVD